MRWSREIILLDYRKSDFAAELEAIFNRPSYPPTIEEAVRTIVNNVRSEGDKALQRYALEFDKAELTPDQFKVSASEIAAAEKSLDKSAKAAIRTALKNVQAFAKLRIPKAWKKVVRKGVTLGEQFVPMERIGVYIPGGTAPLVSTQTWIPCSLASSPSARTKSGCSSGSPPEMVMPPSGK